MGDTATPRTDLSALVRATIEKLRAKLLDLTLSNRLLNFKPSEKSKTHILIINEIPEVLFARLEAGKELEFAWIEDPDVEPADERTTEFIEEFKRAEISDTLYLEQLEKLGKRPSRRQISNLQRGLRDRVRLSLGLDPRVKPSVAERARELGINPSYDLPREVDRPTDVRSDSKIQTLLYRENMEIKLSAIREADKTLLDDAGVNALYAAFGSVEWYESSDSDLPVHAPLLFVPVEIQRVLEHGVYHFVLKLRDDDIETNQAFAELIKATHGLELPPWNPEGTMSQYFEQLERLLQSQRRWRLRRWVTVGLFTFAKMAMYRDLEAKRWSGQGGLDSHAILNDLLAGAESVSEATLAPDYEIDSPSIANKNHILVTDADSSQHSALIDALEGKNLVVQGPPGTGKSQTITNIIAAAMNEGKRVLFVAEKMAALKVVKDRLDSFGLGQFCLEVHSNKTRKTAVLKSLEERLNLSGSSSEGKQLQQTVESYDQARSDLIHYADKMKEQVGETGLSVHDVLRANCVRTPLGEQLPLGLRRARVLEPMTVTEGRRSELKDLAKDLQSRAASVNSWEGLAKHPWRGLENEDLDVFQSDELQAELASWSQALKSLQIKVAELNNATGWGVEDRPKSAATFVALVRALPLIPAGAVESIIHEAAAESGRSLMNGIIRDLENLTVISERLSTVFADSESLNRVKVADVHSALILARDLNLKALTVGAIEELKGKRERSVSQLRQSLATAVQFSRLFGIDNPTVSAVDSVVTAVALLADLPEQLLRLREPSIVLERSVNILERGFSQTESLRSARATVMGDFHLVSLPSVPEIKDAANTLQTSGFFARLFGSKYRSARHLYEKIARTNDNRRTRRPGDELVRLSRYLEQKRELEVDAELRQVTGSAFRGLDTQWPDLLLISHWASKVRRELPDGNDMNIRCREVLFGAETGKLLTVLELSRKNGQLDALKIFSETPSSKECSLESLWQTAETNAHRIGELSLKLQRLRINSHVVSSDLEAAEINVAEMMSLRERLNTEDARKILGKITGSQTSTVEVLKGALKFVEGVTAVDLPPSIRAKILCGPTETFVDELKAHQTAAEETLNAIALHKRATVDLGRLSGQEWIEYAEFDDAPIAQLIARIEYALTNRDALQPYLDFLRIERRAKSSSLSALLKHLEGEAVPYAQLGELYEFIFFRSCADSVLSNDPRLRSHSGVTHEQLRKRYQQLDKKIMELRRREIARKLMDVMIPAGNSRGRASEVTGLALIRHQISLQRRHIALRELFKRAGHAVQALKPCFMMSPMSVAQFLDPGGLRFDMVVMDEASQIRPEDALGAIARARQLIVVGDPKQLPPTTFFEKVDRDDLPDDSAEEADIHDLTSQESILDLARGPYQPVRQLRWHYRSQHESLIAFSNYEFYDDRLIVFPSPKGKDPEYGVRLISVDGTYESGLNRAEAETITGAAQEFMQQFPKRSMGIVAMNKPQQELIQKMMDELFATNPETEAYRLRWENSLDAFFVKNLENVQGDERDVIFISTVYGKDAAGNFFQRLGPINGAHGHRRLNVLFTRAKQQIRLFTSMKANDIRIEATSRWGVKALKNYLTYAQGGHLESSEISGKEPDSEFERWVMGMLQESGYEIVPQLGVAGYFIDLAVRDPKRRGAFILGIECDGAMYHSARSARDRDRLRQEALERLNWNIYRIWSTDWFRNPRAEFQKLTNTLETLKNSNSLQ
jgi:very-short-patch-repair endonuclease/DNA polymerase III delta prime subunit